MSGINAQSIKELRERTQAGMSDCKSALVEAEGDMEKAVEIILKKGLAKSAKRGRPDFDLAGSRKRIEIVPRDKTGPFHVQVAPLSLLEPSLSNFSGRGYEVCSKYCTGVLHSRSTDPTTFWTHPGTI